VADNFELTRFEQELLRHLRALPFEAQQHVSRYILKLQREQNTVPRDDRGPAAFGKTPDLVWNMTPDELARMREDMKKEEEDAD